MKVFKILYYCFNIIVGTLIGLITWIPRIILNKLFDVKTDIFSWLEKYFPLPPEDLFTNKITRINSKSFILLLPFLMLFTSCNYKNVTRNLSAVDSGLKFKIIYFDKTTDQIVKLYQGNRNVSNISAYGNRLHFTYKTIIDVEKLGYDTTHFPSELLKLHVTMHVITKNSIFRTKLKLSNLVLYEKDKRLSISRLDDNQRDILEHLITDLALLELQIN